MEERLWESGSKETPTTSTAAAAMFFGTGAMSYECCDMLFDDQQQWLLHDQPSFFDIDYNAYGDSGGHYYGGGEEHDSFFISPAPVTTSSSSSSSLSSSFSPPIHDNNTVTSTSGEEYECAAPTTTASQQHRQPLPVDVSFDCDEDPWFAYGDSIDYKHFADDILAASESLRTKGYAVIPAVLSQQECTDLLEETWRALSTISKGKLTKNRPYDSMKSNNLPRHTRTMIESADINHMEPARKVRRHPKILAIFAALYGDMRLVSSLQSVSLQFPGKDYSSTLTTNKGGRSELEEVYQDPYAYDLSARTGIQSYLTVLPQTGGGIKGERVSTGSPAVRFWENSHRIYRRVVSKQSRISPKLGTHILDRTQFNNIRACYPTTMRLVKPDCPAGSLILWDTRTICSPFYGDSTFSKDNDFSFGRLAFYLSYASVNLGNTESVNLDPEQSIEKRTAYVSKFTTSHVPFPQQTLNHRDNDNDNGNKTKLFETPPTNIIDAYLFGFESYPAEPEKNPLRKMMGDDFCRMVMDNGNFKVKAALDFTDPRYTSSIRLAQNQLNRELRKMKLESMKHNTQALNPIMMQTCCDNGIHYINNNDGMGIRQCSCLLKKRQRTEDNCNNNNNNNPSKRCKKTNSKKR